jgi:succinyl-diaminopimelate desuccinylase
MRRIEAMFAEHDLECEISWAVSGEPFLTATATLIDAVSESINEVQGIRPTASTGGGTSDGRFIARLGTEIVELGPVNATIHSLNEHTDIDELKRLSTIYLGILRRLLASDA